MFHILHGVSRESDMPIASVFWCGMMMDVHQQLADAAAGYSTCTAGMLRHLVDRQLATIASCQVI